MLGFFSGETLDLWVLNIYTWVFMILWRILCFGKTQVYRLVLVLSFSIDSAQYADETRPTFW